MAACGSLQHIFEKPLPDNPSRLQSLSSWKHIKSMKSIEDSSFTEIFGELHFKENPKSASSSPLPLSSPSSPSSSSSWNTNERSNSNKSPTENYFPTTQTKHYRHSDSFSSMNSESLSLCTEGLGFESSDDVEDLKNDINVDLQQQHHKGRLGFTKHTPTDYLCGESKRSRKNWGEFPPPISCIGRSGKPWVCFKPYRQNGRFILQEIRIPTQEFLHACRENGRLRLQFYHSDDEIPEEDEEEEENDVEEEREENEEKGDDKKEEEEEIRI